jgi:hypothetical protein
VHWVLYNIPCGCSGLAEGAQALPAGTREGLNDWRRTGYGGPCPPAGRHRYFHKLYALDAVLPDLRRPRALRRSRLRHALLEPPGRHRPEGRRLLQPLRRRYSADIPTPSESLLIAVKGRT